jgi:hypothetical protein
MVAVVLSMAATTMIITIQRSEAHCYSRWYYPTPQRGCGAPSRHFTRLLHVKYERERTVPNQEQTAKKHEVKPASLPISEMVTRCDDYCVGWPSVEWAPGVEGPDLMVGIAKLRALRNE